MKKVFLLTLVVSLIFGACHQIDIDIDQNISSEGMSPRTPSQRKYDVSLKTATYMAKLVSKDSLKSIRPIVATSLDTVMYVAEYSDGWKVIAADKRSTPILASGSKGTFKQQFQGPGASIWFDDIADQIVKMKRSNLPVNDSVLRGNKDFQLWMDVEHIAEYRRKPRRQAQANEEFDDTESVELVFYRKRPLDMEFCIEGTLQQGPLIQTHWGQDIPWNTNLPQVQKFEGVFVQPPVGCTAVAMAQLLYYTHYKLNIPTGLYHDVAYTGTIYNDMNQNVSMRRTMYVENSERWDWMPLTNSGYYFNYVADLMADVGYRLGMKYTANGSGAFLTKEAMQSFGITYDEKDYNLTDVIN